MIVNQIDMYIYIHNCILYIYIMIPTVIRLVSPPVTDFPMIKA